MHGSVRSRFARTHHVVSRLPVMRRSGSSLVVLLACLLGAHCTNEASTEPGDPPADAGMPSPLGPGLRIAEMNNPDSAVQPANNQLNVYATGASYITTDTFAETGTASSVGNVYVQDFFSPVDGGGAPPYSGMLLYKNTYVPSNLVLAPGDVIDFTGEYQRYDGPSSFSFGPNYQPEMYESVVTFRFDYSPLPPTVIPLGDLSSWSTGLKWMSMLVTIKSTPEQPLIIGGFDPGSDQRCGIFITKDTSQNAVNMDNELFDLDCQNAYLTGTPITSITGIVTYFDSFTISPRGYYDIDPPPMSR